MLRTVTLPYVCLILYAVDKTLSHGSSCFNFHPHRCTSHNKKEQVFLHHHFIEEEAKVKRGEWHAAGHRARRIHASLSPSAVSEGKFLGKEPRLTHLLLSQPNRPSVKLYADRRRIHVIIVLCLIRVDG